jgi:hypothetical protein
VAAALTPQLLVACGVLCVAGVFKLRDPVPAIRVLALLRLPARPAVVRLLAGAELALGGWCAIAADRLATAAVAFVFASFAVLSLRLVRLSASCGCFGDAQEPASLAQVVLSAVLALAALAATMSGAGGLGWVLQRSGASGVVLLIAISGAVYATVLAYTELPQAWNAWRTSAGGAGWR